MIKKTDVDIIGLQEVSFRQFNYLKSQLTNFAMIGFAALTGHPLDKICGDEPIGEIVLILYKRERIDCLHSQVFWLSPTPDRISIGWDATTVRILTGGVFQIKQTGVKFIVGNVHYDHKGQEAIVNSGTVEINSTEQLRNKYKVSEVFYLGDRNCFTMYGYPGNKWFTLFLQNSGAKDTRACGNHIGLGTTFMGYLPDKYQATYNTKSEKFDPITIDIIFYKGEKFEVKRSMCSSGEYTLTKEGKADLLPFFRKIKYPEKRQFASDHACLLADFTPKPPICVLEPSGV